MSDSQQMFKSGETEVQDINGEQTSQETEQIVIVSQPKSQMSESQQLAALGLRPNSQTSDPCLCFGCVFCIEFCFAPAGGAPPVGVDVRMARKAIGGHNWDNDSADFAAIDNTDDGLEWAIGLANHFTGNDGGHHSSSHYHHNDDGCDGEGGDGGGGDGGGGGGDGGGGD